VHQQVTNVWEDWRRTNPQATRLEIEDFANKVDEMFRDQWFK
jgi:hypothetical protein